MADRCTLHRSKFDQFKAWAIADGWCFSEGKGDYQVAQFRKKNKAGKKRCMIVYDRLGGEHFSTLDEFYPVVRAFINATRKSGV